MFGRHVRKVRESLREKDRSYSVRQVARRIGVEPAYLSKVERDEVAPPSEGKIRRLAMELGEDSDVLLSMAGKVSSDLLEIIRRRPQAFGALLRSLAATSDRSLRKMVRDPVRKR